MIRAAVLLLSFTCVAHLCARNAIQQTKFQTSSCYYYLFLLPGIREVGKKSGKKRSLSYFTCVAHLYVRNAIQQRPVYCYLFVLFLIFIYREGAKGMGGSGIVSVTHSSSAFKNLLHLHQENIFSSPAHLQLGQVAHDHDAAFSALVLTYMEHIDQE